MFLPLKVMKVNAWIGIQSKGFCPPITDFLNATFKPYYMCQYFSDSQVKLECWAFEHSKGGEDIHTREWIVSLCARFLMRPIKSNQLLFHGSFLQYFSHIILKWNQFPSPPSDELPNLRYQYVTDCFSAHRFNWASNWTLIWGRTPRKCLHLWNDWTN